MEKFNYKSLEEYKRLSTEAKKQYLEDLSIYLKGIREKVIGHKFRKKIHPLLLNVMGNMNKFELVPVGMTDKNKEEMLKIMEDGPVIFAINHSNVNDVPTSGTIIKEHGYLLASDEVRGKFNGFLFELIGVVWVQREKNAEKKKELSPKEHMIKLLQENQSIKTFPERTWNVSDNDIILPFKWGDVSISQETGRPIIPIIMEYDYNTNKCHYNIGEAIYIPKGADKLDENNNLRDKMATLRYEIWETKDIERKQKPGYLTGKEYTDLARKEFEEYKKELREEYPTFDEQEEAKMIYRPYTTQEEAFKHLEKIKPTTKNGFLFSK